MQSLRCPSASFALSASHNPRFALANKEPIVGAHSDSKKAQKQSMAKKKALKFSDMHSPSETAIGTCPGCNEITYLYEDFHLALKKHGLLPMYIDPKILKWERKTEELMGHLLRCAVQENRMHDIATFLTDKCAFLTSDWKVR